MRSHGAAGLPGGVGLAVCQSVVLRDKDGDKESEQNGTSSKQEGRAGDKRPLQHREEETGNRKWFVRKTLGCVCVTVYVYVMYL